MELDLFRIVLVAFHVLVSLFLILVVLLQTGKGASLGAAFGGASDTMFGARGAGSFLSKMTTVVAIVFILTSLALATPYFTPREKGSVTREKATSGEPRTPPNSGAVPVGKR